MNVFIIGLHVYMYIMYIPLYYISISHHYLYFIHITCYKRTHTQYILLAQTINIHIYISVVIR